MMDKYEKCLDYMYEQLPMFQRKGASAYKASLDNTIALDKMFCHPHKNFKTIHVGGTNGKGSSSHMLASVLQEAGYKVGLYTSPHLVDFRERIRINGEMIDKCSVIDFIDRYKKLNVSESLAPSFFELTMMMAFEYFSQKKVDIAVIEVGLGGRLDSTNIITPEACLITNISLDHTSFLGNDLESIAKEKAGIIKPKIPVVLSESNQKYNNIFQQKANAENSELYIVEDEDFPNYTLDLKGIYQQKNIRGVLKLISLLKGFNISEENIINGLANVISNTKLRGRWEVIQHNPMLVCDTAHNVAGIEIILEQIKTIEYNKLWIVLGMVNDKDLNGVLKLLPKNANYIFTQASLPRAIQASELAKQAEEYNLYGVVIPKVKEAVNYAKIKALKDDLIYVGGSTFVVADFFE